MHLEDIIEACKTITKEYGNVSGDISFKDGSQLLIKAPGVPLNEVKEDGFISLDRDKLRTAGLSFYPENIFERESLFRKSICGCFNQHVLFQVAPVDVQIHNILNYRYVTHLQSAVINGLLCSRSARNVLRSVFGENIFFIQYADPGYSLFRKIESDLAQYRQNYPKDPEMIFVESYGIIISSDSAENIGKLFSEATSKIMAGIQPLPEISSLPYNPLMNKVLPVLRMLVSTGNSQIARFRHNTLIQQYYNSQQEFHKISLPLSPSIVSRCRTRFLYIEQASTPERILDSFRYQLPNFINEYGYTPGTIVIRGMGVFAFSDTCISAEESLNAFEDHVKISYYSSQRGGSKFLTPEQVAFLVKQPAEARSKNENTGRLKNTIAVITGPPEGPGAEIAESLFKLGSNMVVADNNEIAGNKLVSLLNKDKGSNLAVFVNTDMSDPLSVREMLSSTVKEFGGIDLMICNAGLPGRTKSVENDGEGFSKVNNAYYKSYYLGAANASEIMKIQNSGNPEHFCDIIHINHLQYFKDENLNPAYSGASSACIGLTSSFALDLAPYRIKVNTVCPGNFFEDPFWTDPQKGLFIQYLKAGKIQGARTTEDVKQFFENKVPLKRGCKTQDLLKALLYIVDQEYETGQVIKVSGGLSVS